MLARERERVAAAAARLARERLVIGTAGNVSERSGDLVAITPTGANLEHLTPDQVTVVGVDGRHRAGELAATSEVDLHLGVYRRYDAGAVVHTHSPMATALSCVIDELPVIHYQMLLLGGPIRVAPYATFGSPELAEVTLDAMQDRLAALMSNHGAIVCGPDLDVAVDNVVLLEWACTVYWRAAALGTPRTLGEREQQQVVSAAIARNYGAPKQAEG
jgi:L-fuculose-phosphate aldolase